MDELERPKSSKTRSLRGDLRCDHEASGASSLGSTGVASTWPNARCDSSCIISCCSRALERWERSGLRGTLNRHGAERDRQMRGRRAALRHQSTRRSRPASSFANSHTRVAVAGSRIWAEERFTHRQNYCIRHSPHPPATHPFLPPSHPTSLSSPSPLASTPVHETTYQLTDFLTDSPAR